jgi:hypothetical protein
MHYNTTYTPAFPEARIRITFKHKGRMLGIRPFNALVDTGADNTCIPVSLVPQEPDLFFRRREVRYADGKQTIGKFLVLLNAEVEFLDHHGNRLAIKQHQKLELLLIHEALLGRDILNYHASQFDGPKMLCHIS